MYLGHMTAARCKRYGPEEIGMYQVVSIYDDMVDVLGTYATEQEAESAARKHRVRLEPIGCDVEVRQ